MKKLTVENWLEPDEVSALFISDDPTDRAFGIATTTEWIRGILEPELVETVPKEVKELFEVARGALAYGYLFYPLYTLATEQLYRVVEAGVARKYEAMHGLKPKSTFKEKAEWLINEGVIPKEEEIVWDAIRELRNMVSHPRRQSIITPGMALGILEQTAEKVNLLFADA